jgi:hypothetical protein
MLHILKLDIVVSEGLDRPRAVCVGSHVCSRMPRKGRQNRDG